MPGGDFSFRSVLRPNDTLAFGQACSEPVGLVRQLLAEGEALHDALGRLQVFVAGSYSGLIHPDHARCFDFFSYGAFGDVAALARAGRVELHPVHYSQLVNLLTRDRRADVVLLQLSPADAQGRHSLGVANDFQLAVARQARVVVAEVNARVPFSPHALLPADVRIDHAIHTDHPLVEIARAPVDAIAERIATQVAALVEDESTLQMGIGSLMEAICGALRGHRGLGIHSGILTDAMADLMRQGVVTNAHKTTHIGRTVAASLLGGRDLFDFAHANDDVFLAETHVTHGSVSLRQQHRFCSINSAVEVDLSGQVNAEVSHGRYVGAVGGQVDFVRAASQSEDGRSIIALPSSARQGSLSRIVARLSGPVTTARSDVDHVVTEWGTARLRGLSLPQRARALIAIAHPEHREGLQRAAQAIAHD